MKVINKIKSKPFEYNFKELKMGECFIKSSDTKDSTCYMKIEETTGYRTRAVNIVTGMCGKFPPNYKVIKIKGHFVNEGPILECDSKCE